MPTVTVAIVTARRYSETKYDDWRQIRRDFLSRRKNYSLPGAEFAALLASCLATPAEHHVEYQLRALDLGTQRPDQVIVIDRCQDRGVLVDAVANRVFRQPFLSTRELELNCCSVLGQRSTDTSFGCSDKNTAIALCTSDLLIMLDDCCLPSFGLVEAVANECVAEDGLIHDGPIILIGHRKVYSCVGDRVDYADANWTETPTRLSVAEAQARRRVMGIWAMPLRTALALNGFNPLLDGSRNGLDEELMVRADRLAEAEELQYCLTPAARCYEIEHAMPWSHPDADVFDWRDKLPAGYRAPGPDLYLLNQHALHDAYAHGSLKGTRFDT